MPAEVDSSAGTVPRVPCEVTNVRSIQSRNPLLPNSYSVAISESASVQNFANARSM